MMSELSPTFVRETKLVSVNHPIRVNLGPVVVYEPNGSAHAIRPYDGTLVPLPSDPVDQLTVLDNFEDKDGGFYA